MELRTDRLILRPWRDADLDPFAALCADPVVMEHFPAPLDRAATAAMIERIRAAWARDGFGVWAVEELGGSFIGFTGLIRHAVLPDEVEVGWRLARAAWGRGLATEAARAAVDHAFGALGLPALISMTVPANVRSQRVMTKLGFTRNPEDDFDHPNVLTDHPLRRHWLFRLRAGSR